MIGSLFENLQPIPNNEGKDSPNAEDLSYDTDSDDYLLASLPVVQKIVRRKTVFSWHSEASDLVQAVALRLLNWRNRNLEKSEEMSKDEWQSFAAKTAYNEINRQFADNSLKDVSLDSVQEAAAEESIEGQSEVEVFSLALEVWQKICNMSLRQRQALLFGSQELVIYLLKIGITDEELAEKLNLTMGVWAEVKNRLPLKNLQIAELLKEIGNENSIEAIAKSMKKARHEARLKVRRVTEK
jgi:DNA-directed RNA polymerase specialized sigma24 family protein